MEIFNIKLWHQLYNLHALNLKQVIPLPIFIIHIKHIHQFIQ